jgi:hypothetical protein
MSMPQYITNVTSFKDAVRILKNKAILNEADINELSPQTKYNALRKSVDNIKAASSTSDSKYKKALSQGAKFANIIDPVLNNAIKDFGKSLGFDTSIEKKATGAQYEPVVHIKMGRDLREPQIKVIITKDTDKIEGRVNLPNEAAERKLANLIKQVQQKELDVELKDLNESDLSRDAELGGVEEDFKQLLAKGYSYSEALELIAQNTGMDPDELESMLPQDAVDTEGYEDEDDELDAIIAKMGSEEEAEKAIKGGFGIQDPLEEANGEFPRDPREMAQAIADEFGNELLSLSGIEREKMAISHAYEKILNSGHPKAKIIARNLAFGYADEDWPMEYISTLNQKLKTPTPEIPMFKGTRDALDSLSIREGKKKKEPKKELHPNQIHPSELRMGIKAELEHTDSLDKAKKIALDHLAENPYYYTALKLAGVDSPSAPKAKVPVAFKKEVTAAVELVDKINAMKPVKGFEKAKASSNKAKKETNSGVKGVSELTHNAKSVRGVQKFAATGGKMKTVKALKEARLNINGEPNAVVKQAMAYVDGPNANPVLKALSNEIEFQQTQDSNQALLRYDYWKELPEEAVKKLELQFNVEKDGYSDEDTGEVIVYRLTPKSSSATDLESSLEMGARKAGRMSAFREALEKMVRKAIAETFDGRDNLTDVE